MAKRTLEVIKAEIEANISAYNEAYVNEDFNAISAAETTQDELEKEYAALAEKVCYNSLKETDKPMLEAIKQYGYDVLRHKDIKSIEKIVVDGEEKSITKVVRELVVKEKQIDLIKFDNYGDKTSSVNPM